MDALRLANADVPALPHFDLWAELQRATLALAFAEPGDARDWLQARVEALAAERRRRQAKAAKGVVRAVADGMPGVDLLGRGDGAAEATTKHKQGASHLPELVEEHGAYPFRDDVQDAHLTVPLVRGGIRTMPVRSRACKSFLGWLLWQSDRKAARARPRSTAL